MPKRVLINKRLCEEEQQAIGAIYKQYIDTFQENSDVPRKTFVKSDTLYAEQGKQSCEKGQLYNPKPIIKYKKEEPNQPTKSASPVLCVKRAKKKSNLKSLGDELKMLQHERQAKEVKLLPKIEPLPIVNHDGDYSNSTNLFVSNLSPHITENHLIRLFGTYGPLASVKIMWPRNEVSCRSANCGFVAFMSRVDAERALNGLKNHEDMRINWGKSVKIPSHPVHIPPQLYKLYSPPPPSGLPFNAQIFHLKSSTDPDVLATATVRVTIPFDRNLLMIIHRTIEFVVREGPEFEAVIMNMESGNPDFSFLTDFQSPAHTYYRWKLYSILNGDPKNSWSMKPFRMYKNGSIWIPPTAPNYKDGMPKELILTSGSDVKLSKAQTDRLIYLIKSLTIAKGSIAEVMVFVLNHVTAINDAMDILVDSFKNPSTNPVKKVARLYLLSDLLYNCKNKQIRIDKFTDPNCEIHFEIFKQFYNTYKGLNYPQDRNCLKTKILMVLRAWVFHNFYDVKFITKLENMFLYGNEQGEDDDNSLNDEPLDGANLLKRSYQTATADCLIVNKEQVKEIKQFVDIFNPCANFSFDGDMVKKKKN
ncbi:Surp and/or RRM 1 domain containing protein [Asbolus verrucosus]|uniref:Surp and/or RRM 1 domain containing protein n=1 Tax=Asbolus verrucosus TaxID=1661398 RepID=A0A482W191_ASBVE|nr:Surp and/or RRM 1 domain containing protein [Asbolus verrucosus]